MGLAFFLLLFSSGAWAFIPRARTILGRLVKNDGNGIYLIHLDVQFQQSNTPVTTHESWLIANGDSMRLIVTIADPSGSNVRALTVLYKAGDKYTLDQSGRWRKTRMPSEAIEPLFNFRSALAAGEYLIEHQMAAPGILAREHISNVKKIKLPKSDPNTILARLHDVITFGIGFHNGDNGTAEPHIWIDEDKFVIKKILFLSGARVLAHKQEPFAHGIVYPKDRVVNWGDNTVNIKTVSVESMGLSAAKQLNLNYLTRQDPVSAALPSLPIVAKFYSRFR